MQRMLAGRPCGVLSNPLPAPPIAAPSVSRARTATAAACTNHSCQPCTSTTAAAAARHTVCSKEPRGSRSSRVPCSCLPPQAGAAWPTAEASANATASLSSSNSSSSSSNSRAEVQSQPEPPASGFVEGTADAANLPQGADRAAPAANGAAASSNGSKSSNGSRSSGRSAKAVLQPVTYVAAQSLPPQSNWQSALAALQVALQTAAAQLSSTLPPSTTSGVLRFEVPLSRGGPPGGVLPGSPSQPGFSALQWLQGQEGLRKTLHTVYFSGRHSTAPDTPATAAAEAGAQGWGALAGLGAAWLWQGDAGRGFHAEVMAGLTRFLSEGQPRLRVMGGSRFNTKQQPSAEWAAFGSFLFLLPQLEVVEGEGALIISLNVAWDARLPAQAAANAAAAGSGPASLTAAVQQAVQVLQAACPPANACSPSLAPAVGPVQHTPDEQGWEQLLTGAVGVLRAGEAPQQNPGVAGVDTGFARQEFISGGQQSLDELLSSLLSGPDDPPPLATSTLAEEEADDDHHNQQQQQQHSSAGTPNGDATAAGLNGSSGSVSEVTPGMQRVLTAPDGEAKLQFMQQQLQLQQGSGRTQPGSQQQQQEQQADQQPLVKVVLARRTAIPWEDTPAANAAAAGGSAPAPQPQQPQQQLPAGWQRRSGAVLLQALQERDPRAYQLLLSTPPGSTFIACTPERLYVRSGRLIASEAVAGTRPRGPPGDLEADFYQGLDLLQSPKDHAEFTLVRDWIRQQLAPLCVELKTEVQKSVLKQAAVQHLYGRLAGVLRRGVGDAAVLEALHPTPAVCGRPREAAMKYLQDSEPFDRGFYAGPFGWVSGQGAEFVVAIRSAMVPTDAAATGSAAGAAAGVMKIEEQQSGLAVNMQQQQHTGQLLAYAGVGVVAASEVAAEWQELCLKVRQFEGMLSPLLSPPLPSLPNAQMAWAALAIEELTRLGVATFAVAPGSRSSPLALAAASHPRTQLTVAIDERSLGFWALGYGRANASGRPAAVICSSGTAVANLLPSVVEASQSLVPMLLLTADRPYELRDTGANQTIDQVKIFGGYTRWSSDVCPPSEALPGRVIVSTVDTAVRMAMAAPAPGPVHLNFQFREPLAPVASNWSPSYFLRGLEAWQQSAEPYTATLLNPTPIGQPLPPHNLTLGLGFGPTFNPADSILDQHQLLPGSAAAAPAAVAGAVAAAGVSNALDLLLQAQRGLIVVGEQLDSGAAAAALQLAALLGWPVAADVLSGLRVGSNGSSGGCGSSGVVMLHHMDHLLLPPPGSVGSNGSSSGWWEQLQPDVVLQVGPRVTSKRLNQFMEWSALPPVDGSRQATPWLFVSPAPQRHDAAHLLTAHLSMTPQQLLLTAAAAVQQQQRQRQPTAYARLLQQLDAAAAEQIDVTLSQLGQMSEMAVARALSVQFPAGFGLFLGNSMPIRDMDMYAGARQAAAATVAAAQVPVVTLSSAAAAAAVAAAAAGGGGVASDSESGSFDSFSQQGSSNQVLSAEEARHSSSGSADSIGSMPPGGLLAWRGSSSSSGSSQPPDPSTAAYSSTSSLPDTLVGVPVAANRGASGIDGVLSSAAGFAAGLQRPVTLVIGDLSFLHDVNGLSLLRGGEMAPPLTVVLINNKGGGIFSFLPVADAVGRAAFERLWGTPQNVDLEGLCRAHGIPHQSVTTPQELPAALATAWGINRHSVVEVITDRADNVRLHRQLQADVAAAVHAAHRSLTAAPQPPQQPQQQQQQPQQQQQQQQQQLVGGLPLLPPIQLQPELHVSAVHVQQYSIPLTKSLTSTDSQQQQQDVASPQTQPNRQGFLLTVQLAQQQQHQHQQDVQDLQHQHMQQGQQQQQQRQQVFAGVGEAAPLPGLHSESLGQVSEQLAMLTHLLQGLPVPRTLALLSSNSITRWFKRVAGLNPAVLHPTVRHAVESALLQAVAAAQGCDLAQLLSPGLHHISSSGSSGSNGAGSSEQGVAVCVNGLLPGVGSVGEVVAAAEALVAAGASVLKVKVGRRDDPAADAAVIMALHKALNRISSSSQRVVLTADANRAWTLQQALCFAVAMEEGLASSNAERRRRRRSRSSGGSSSSSVLAYVEEPTQDPRDMSTFYAETGIAVAVDESLDEGLVGPQHVLLNPAAAEAGLNPDDSSSSRERLDLSDSSGLVAVVIKPAVVGGFERAWGLAHWAQQEGLRVVISSSFESSVGLAALVQLAAAVDAAAAGSTSSSSSSDGGNSGASSNVLPNGLWAGFGGSGLPGGTTAAAAAAAAAAGAAKAGNAEKQQQQQQQWHGLGTLSWFAGDAVGHANSLRCFGSSIPAAAAWKLLQQTGTAAAADGTTSSSSSNGTPDLQLCGSCVLPVQYQVLSAAGTPMVVTGSLVTPSSSSSSSGSNGQLPVVLLHGFMGADTDWHPLMAALAAAGHSCLAVNLPGHGGTGPAAAAAAAVAAGECYSLETAAAVAEQAAAAAFGAGTPCLLIGYSMGARAAMQAVLGKQSSPPPQQQQGAAATSSTTTPSSNGSSSSSRDTVRWAGAVLISGTPGIPDPELRAARVAKDQELADLLRAVGAASFLRWWYRQPLWASLRAYPGFERLLVKRVGEQEGQEEQLAASLTYASTGRMVPLWGEVRSCQVPLLLVAGQMDSKFAGIKRRMMARLRQGLSARAAEQQQQQQQHVVHQWAEVPGVGHAVHVEAPLQLLQLIKGFTETL